MVFGDGHEERFAEQFGADDFRLANWESKDGEIKRAGAKPFEQFFGRGFANVEIDLRGRGAEGRHGLGQSVGQDGGNDADSEPAAAGMLETAKFLFGLADRKENLLGAGDQGLPVMGKADAAAEAVKERYAQCRFQFLNLLRKRRLGEVFFFGGPDKAAGARYREKVAELV